MPTNDPNPFPGQIGDRRESDWNAFLGPRSSSTGKKSQDEQDPAPQRRQGNRFLKISAQISFLILGVVSTLWFLVRVIPKPSRATYPCMQAAAPFMSGFILYLMGLGATTLALHRVRKHLAASRYKAAILFAFAAGITAILTLTNDYQPVYANSTLLSGQNNPVGVPRGIYPGRVVWVWDSNSTNEHCTNSFGDGWFQDNNTKMSVVGAMVDSAILRLTGRGTIAQSWDALFRYFNQAHGKGNVGYLPDEKIFIRTNQVSASNGTFDTATFAIKNQSRYGMAETSPHVVLAVLRQLVNESGVPQENIAVGDPMKHMYKHMYDLLHNEFPGVVFIDKLATHGRTAPVSESQPSVVYSDRGQS